MTTTTLRPTNLNHFMNSFFAPGGGCANVDRQPRHMPRAEILEGDKDYIIRMDLPGVNRENLEIEIEEQTLTVSATREHETPEGYRSVRNERAGATTSYKRAFSLGRSIATDDVTANLEHGTLTLTLPKSEQTLARRIEVK